MQIKWGCRYVGALGVTPATLSPPIREEASLPDLLLYRRLSCAASSLEEALLVSCHKNTSWVSFSLCLVGRGWS